MTVSTVPSWLPAHLLAIGSSSAHDPDLTAPRHARINYGGVCLFYVDNLHVRPVSLQDYDAFEHVCVYVQGSGFNTLVVVVYRPGSETVTDAFFVSLTDLLERTVTYL